MVLEIAVETCLAYHIFSLCSPRKRLLTTTICSTAKVCLVPWFAVFIWRWSTEVTILVQGTQGRSMLGQSWEQVIYPSYVHAANPSLFLRWCSCLQAVSLGIDYPLMNLDETAIWWGLNSSRKINSDTSETVRGTEEIHSLDFAVTLTLPFSFIYITFFKRWLKTCFVERCDFSPTFPLPNSGTTYVWQCVYDTGAVQSMTNASFLGSSYWTVSLADRIEKMKAGWGFHSNQEKGLHS